MGFEQALSALGTAGHTFHRVTEARLVTVVPHTPNKRREYEQQVVKTFFLSNADLKETIDLLRVVLGARRVAPLPGGNALTINDAPDRVAAAERIIEIVDKKRAEVVVDVEILEVNRSGLKEYGIELGRGFKGRLAATGMAAGLAGFMAGGALGPGRWALERFVLPSPGEGPTPEQQQKGFFDLRFAGRTADGRMLRTRVTGDRDRGYGSTARMLGQAGACLARDVPKDAKAGGFWTPATIFGDRLIERLEARSGLRFEVRDDKG